MPETRPSRGAHAGVIFDLDGVLIDSEALHYRAYSAVLERFGVSVSRELYAVQWIAGGRGPEYAVATYDLPITANELRHRKQPIYHALLQEEAVLMPGVEAAVDRLQARFPLAVATNSSHEDVDWILRRFGLWDHFEAVIGREDYVAAKPEPDAFLAAASRLGVPPSRCLVVEDAERGVLAARRAGAIPVAIPHEFTRNHDFSGAARILSGLDDVTPELVSEILRLGSDAA